MSEQKYQRVPVPKKSKFERNLQTIVGGSIIGFAANVLAGPEFSGFMIETAQQYLGDNVFQEVALEMVTSASQEEYHFMELAYNFAPALVYVTAPVAAAVAIPKLIYDNFFRRETPHINETYRQEFTRQMNLVDDPQEADYLARRNVTIKSLANSTGSSEEVIAETLNKFLDQAINKGIILRSVSADDSNDSSRKMEIDTLNSLISYSESNTFMKKFSDAGGGDAVMDSLANASVIATVAYVILPLTALSIIAGAAVGARSFDKNVNLRWTMKGYLIGKNKEVYDRFVKELPTSDLPNL